MKEKLKSIKNSYLTYAILFVIILILIGITVSYASFKVNKANSSTASNIGVSLECMNITYSETNTIDLDYNYPISDSYALENVTPVTITVTNNCTSVSNVNYTLAISSLFNNTGYIEDDQIRMKASRKISNESEYVIRTPMYLNMLDAMPEGDALTVLKNDLKTRENANSYQNTSSYIIDSNTISAGKTITYKVYLWVDYYEGDLTRTGLKDNSTAGKNFAAAISMITNDDLHELELGDAYALYTESNNTLTFVRSVFPIEAGDTYNDVEITEVYAGFEEESYTYNTIPWYTNRAKITNVLFENEIRPTSTAYWFAFFGQGESVESFNLSKLNTSLVNNMTGMFEMVNFETLDMDLSEWNVSNVINMSDMFYSASWKSLDLSNWVTSNVTDMNEMFSMEDNSTVGPVPIGLSDWNVSNVTNMQSMFAFSTFVLDLSNWNVSNVINMYYMFGYSNISKVGDLSKWDVSNVTDMGYMFNGASNLTSLGDISKWNTGNVTDMTGMFFDVELIDLPVNLSGWDVSKVLWHSDFSDSDTITPPVWKK